MHNILGITVLKTVLRNIENVSWNWRKPLTHCVFVSISEHVQYFVSISEHVQYFVSISEHIQYFCQYLGTYTIFLSVSRNVYNIFENAFCDRLVFLLKIRFNTVCSNLLIFFAPFFNSFNIFTNCFDILENIS